MKGIKLGIAILGIAFIITGCSLSEDENSSNNSSDNSPTTSPC